jgi:ubiquinone/menaquinone biosynthesis C-methylase UbiE
VAEKFDAQHAHRLENPERFGEMPPERLVELLALNGAETLVDFGAGTGLYSLRFAEALPEGEVIAVEEQAELAAMLRAKLPASPFGDRVRVVVNAGGTVPLPDGIAGRLVMINVLHHIHDDEAALTEALRLLAPGGLLLVAEFARMERPMGPPNDHLLSLADLHALLDRLGLRERVYRAPGEAALYHHILVADKPTS